ncbi:DUF1674 domain-containing protein [Salinisphaera sp. SPP-AMP-43]|uniref:DUF1674 domain-containing protein n=1 Tax=Salinisphaera sp. SPP-AMP-43 TaxID=3121288 RepID=UPI003C6DDBA5
MPKQPVTSAEEPHSGVDPASPQDRDLEPHADPQAPDESAPDSRPREYGGPKGPDPVRYGDWEKNGRCIDF